jgi:hypothetical protein
VDDTKKVIAVVSLVAIFGVAIYESKAPHVTGRFRAPAALDGQQEMMDAIIKKVVDDTPTRDQIIPTVRFILEKASHPEARGYPLVQIAAGIARLVPRLEGFIWRLRPIAEPSDYLHATVLYKIRQTYYNDYLYGPHVKALLDFITEPSEGQDQKPNEFIKSSELKMKFATVADAQDWLLRNITPELEKLIYGENGKGGLTALEGLPDRSFVYDFDRTLLVGHGNGLTFIDPEEARKLFIKPYLYTMKFLLQRALMGIYYVSALELNDLPKVAAKVLSKTELNEFRGELRPEGKTAKGMTPEILYTSYRDGRRFLSFRNTTRMSISGAERLLDRAFELGLESAEYQLRAYVCGITYVQASENRGVADPRVDFDSCSRRPDIREGETFVRNGNKYLFDPNSMIESFKSKFTEFKERAELFEVNKQGRCYQIHSDVTGDTFCLNARKAFFSTLSGSQRDLLPYQFELPGQPSQTVNLPDFPREPQWNYTHGRPTDYRNTNGETDFTMNGFFDKGATIDDLKRNMTTLLYTKSVAPFAAFIRYPSPVRFFITTQDLVRAND